MFKFEPKTIDENELEKIIIYFKNKFSTGWDEVPMPIIKQARKFLLKPLVHLINSSIVTSIFPNKLKLSKVKPLFKKGDCTELVNYRPVSLLPSFSKLYERVMFIQLTEFLEKHKLLDKEQYGFREGKSVVNAGIDFVESVIDSVDRGEEVVGVFLDLTKAFDSVTHEILLSKLQSVGVADRAHQWFRSYLDERKQYVEVEHLENNQLIRQTSAINYVKYGVPQGSILGPLLFLIYLTGLPSVVECPTKVCIYADDINVKVSGLTKSDIEISTEIALSDITQYLLSSNLLPNTTKTKYIQFSTSRKTCTDNIKIDLNNEYLEGLKTIKFLGFHIDNNLNWNHHVSVICNKISSGIYALKNMVKHSNLETLKLIYYAFIESHISFGLCLYGSCRDLNSILILQKKALRVMLKLKWQDSVKEYFKDLGILTVFALYIYQLILNIKLNLDKLPKLGKSHHYNTRRGQELAYDYHKLTFYTKKPSYAGIKFYNSLPNIIKDISDYKKFKNELKTFLIHKPLYSLDEYFL